MRKIDHENDWWQAVADAIEEGYIAIDKQGQITGYNKAALQTLGLSADVLRDPGNWTTPFLRPLADLVRKRKTVSHQEVVLEREDGSFMLLRLNAKVLVTDTATDYLMTFTDITPRIHTESHDTTLTATGLNKLLATVNEKNIVLHATSVDLQEHIRQLQEFNSIIAHNLRGPATALMGSTDLLPEVHGEKDRDTLLLHMKATAGSILGTLNDMKEMIDLQVSKQSPFTDCELEAMVKQVWTVLSPQIVEKNAHLSLNLTVPVINYVKVYLENILFNLINNAMTYTRKGVAPEITVATWKADSGIVLMVQDNGIGIDLKKHHEQLFRYKRKFHRGYESNGVSLFKIRNQVRTFGGNIEVKSEAGKGCSFYVYFNNREYTLQQDE